MLIDEVCTHIHTNDALFKTLFTKYIHKYKVKLATLVEGDPKAPS